MSFLDFELLIDLIVFCSKVVIVQIFFIIYIKKGFILKFK